LVWLRWVGLYWVELGLVGLDWIGLGCASPQHFLTLEC
jgi:hypothetical protein